ncbi:MAG TPA: hypothetical protein VK791_03410 [bacterium]|jgi:hypothetical protein|nr:hypothetical protein [bacterium]
MVLKIGFLYFAFIAWGCLTLLPFVALREIGQGFYRFFGFMCVALQTLSIGLLLMAGTDLDPVYKNAAIALGISLFFTLSFTVALRIRRQWFLWSCFTLAVVSGLAAIIYFPWLGQEHLILQSVHSLIAALVMGAVILAMMLGHWYLVTPKLSITPLKRYSNSYILLTVLTALELILNYTLFVGWGAEPLTEPGRHLLYGEIMFVLFRVAWGILPPLGMAYWIWVTVNMKSTQSATGILYAAMVCTMIGEGMGLYLTLATGVPF